MASTLKNKIVKDVGKLPILAFETNQSTRAVVLGINLSNLLDNVVYCTITIHDNTSVEGYYLKNIMLPANSTLKALSGGEKLVLEPDNQLYFMADEDDSLDVVVSYAEIV